MVQATLMLLDSCALTRDEAGGAAMSASSSGGGSKGAALTRWLHKRDRLLQVRPFRQHYDVGCRSEVLCGAVVVGV